MQQYRDNKSKIISFNLFLLSGKKTSGFNKIEEVFISVNSLQQIWEKDNISHLESVGLTPMTMSHYSSET